MSDDRERRLGELLSAAVRAVDDHDQTALEAALEAAGDDREELVDLVEAALTLRGPDTPDPTTISELAASPAFAVRAWPDILADARHAQGLQRSALVARLAERIGVVSDSGRERLRVRYHELETGLIDPRGVADTVRDALGALLGGIADTLEATRAVPTGPSLPSVAFQRSNEPELALGLEIDALTTAVDEAPDAEIVDRLFGVDR